MKNTLRKSIAMIILMVLIIAQLNFVAFITPVNAETPDNGADVEDEHYKYYYDQLSSQAKKIYAAMEKMFYNSDLKTGNENYDLTEKGEISQEAVRSYTKGDNTLIIDFENARDAFYLDYPEVFYVNMESFTPRITKDTKGNLHFWIGTGNNSSYMIKGFADAAAVKVAEATLEEEIGKIVSGAKALESKYKGDELIKYQVDFVQDAIIKKATYKLDNVCKAENRGHIRTPYGALVAGESVCEGYSKSLKVALDRLGIPCILVRGVYKYDSTSRGEGHMWNYVKIADKWYAVDATFDDPDKLDEYGHPAVSTDYLLVGKSTMSKAHYPDGVMSAPEKEFKYPELADYSFGAENVASVDGLEVIYNEGKATTGDKYVEYNVSYRGMNLGDAKKAGYYFLIKYYQKTKPDSIYVSDWMYLGLDEKYPNQTTDVENSFSICISNSNFLYIEIAVTKIPTKWSSTNDDEFFHGDNKDIIANSGLLETKVASYIAPPRITSASPYVGTKLNAGKKTHIKVTYDKALELKETDVKPSAFITTKNAWTNSAEETSRIENFQWDGNKTIELDFTPSTQFGDNSVIYYLNIDGLVAQDSKKVPTPAWYYVQQTFGCTYSMAQSKSWRVYARPTLIDTGDVDVTGWDLGEGPISADAAKAFSGLTDRMALVVNEATENQSQEMKSLIETEQKVAVQKAEMYNINLVLCNKNVLKTANGHKMTIYLGFPAGYGPESAGVTFKAYHFKTEGGKLVSEEIQCVVTPNGLMITCDAFSPFAVAAVTQTAEEAAAAKATKTVVVNIDKNGTTTGLDDAIVTLTEEAPEKTFTIKANEGYKIDLLDYAGNKVEDAAGKDSYELTLKYNDIKSNNGVNVTFVAEEVKAAELERGEQGAEPTEKTAQEHTVIFKDYDGTVLFTQDVEDGKDAVAPEEPTREGYKFVKWDKEFKAVKSDLEVIAVYEKCEEPKEPDEEPTKPANKVTAVEKFKDIQKGKWYTEAAEYVYQNGMILGTSENTFSPADTFSRGMIVTILYRMEGSPKVTAKNKFSDVKSKEYYYNAVNWAASNGIVSGYKNGKFGPNDPVTREQLAIILMNYAKLKGKSTEETKELTGYKDYKKVSNYAEKALSWATAKKVINGNANGTLAPQGKATRAEGAAMLMNYCKNVGK